jgi:hypothetical protein
MAADKYINIGIAVDTDPLKKGMQDAATIAKTESEKIAKAATSGGDAITKSHQAAATATKSLQSQFREAQKEALTLAGKYGLTSAATIEAAKRAGELKDEVADTKAVINAFSADSKFTVLANAMQQAAGVASVVTGTMGLMGAESEKTQQMLLKVQSALAVTTGLAQIKEMGASFTALGAVVKTSVIPSLVTMNATLLANPIVAAVAILAAATIAFYAYSESIDRSVQSTVQIINFSNQATQAITAQTEEIRKRNAELGLTLSAIQQGVTTEQASLNIERDKLTAYQRTYEQLKAQNAEREKTIPYLSTEWLANRNNLAIYKDKVEAQKALVTEMQRAIDVQNQINASSVKTNKISNIVEIDTAGTGSATTQVALNIQKSIMDRWNKIQPQKVSVAKIVNPDLTETEDKLKAQMKGLEATLVNSATQIGVGFFNNLGQSLASGELDMSTLTDMIAQLANTMAAAFVAIGTAASLAPGAQGIAWGYFAAAAGLATAAGVIKGMGAASSPSGGGGGGSSSGGGGGMQVQYAGGNLGGASVRAFASGGIVSGPTFAMVGEYAGAGNNPEVVAPLDRLKSILGGGVGGPMELSTRMYNRDFLLVLKRAQNNSRRI